MSQRMWDFIKWSRCSCLSFRWRWTVCGKWCITSSEVVPAAPALQPAQGGTTRGERQAPAPSSQRKADGLDVVLIHPSAPLRLMLPYEEHLREGGAEFKIPESPLPPKARGMRGRKPLSRGRRPGTKAKEKRITTAASPPAVSAGKRFHASVWPGALWPN